MVEKTPFIQKPLRRSMRVGIDCGEGLTEQAHKQECDMNYILRDYTTIGLLKHAAKYAGKYDDFPAIDFQQAMFMVTQAQAMFDQLPAKWRKRFNNEPAQFLEFVQNPENKDEMKKLGILKGNDGLTLTGQPSTAPVETPAQTAAPGGEAAQTS